MKNFLLFSTIFFFFIGNVISQDTIYKRNAEIVIAIVLEKNPTEIKYKKFDYQDGPTYSESKSNIKQVNYASGMKEVFEAKLPEEQKVVYLYKSEQVDETQSGKIDMLHTNKYRQQNKYYNEREMHKLLINSNDRKIVDLVKVSKRSHGLQYIGFAAIPLGIITLASTEAFNDPAIGISVGGICLLGTIACPIASGVFKKRRNASNQAAVNLYNQEH